MVNFALMAVGDKVSLVEIVACGSRRENMFEKPACMGLSCLDFPGICNDEFRIESNVFFFCHDETFFYFYERTWTIHTTMNLVPTSFLNST